jgi:hypothetical protein
VLLLLWEALWMDVVNKSTLSRSDNTAMCKGEGPRQQRDS